MTDAGEKLLRDRLRKYKCEIEQYLLDEESLQLAPYEEAKILDILEGAARQELEKAAGIADKHEKVGYLEAVREHAADIASAIRKLKE